MKKLFTLFLALLIASPASADITVNGQLKKAQLEKLSTAPTSSEARVYYNTSTKKAQIYNGSAWGDLGGSGQGGTNYVKGPSTATSWTASGTMTGTTVTVGLPRATTTGTGISLASGSADDYVQTCFTIDSVDKSKKLGFSWAQAPSSYTDGDMKAEVYSFTSSSCGGTATALQIDQGGSNTYYSVPNVSGVIPLSFDTTTADYYGIRFTRVTGTSSNVVSNVTVTPDRNTVIGAAVGPGISFTPVTAGLGTITSPTASYWQDGPRMYVNASLTAGTVTSTAASLTLPFGTTASSIAAACQIVGRWVRGNSSASTRKDGAVLGCGGDSKVYFTSVDYTAASSPYTALGGSVLFANSDYITLEFSVPIAEWAGSTVNIGQNGPECAYNTGNVTSAGGSDTTSFGYGTAGTPILSYNSTTPTNSTSFKVEFLNPIQPGERTNVEVSTGTGPYWFDISAVGINQSRQGTSLYGVSIAPVDSTHVTVLFNNGGYASTPATYAGNGAAWSGLSTWKWRSCRVPASQAVGFANATSTSSGLLSRYEEGTFTPTIGGSSSSWTGVTYTAQIGEYTRLGRVVYFTFYVGWSATTGTPSGALVVNGFPYFAKNRASLYQAAVCAEASSIDSQGSATNPTIAAEIQPNSKQAYIVASGDNQASASVLANANGGSTSRLLICSGFYFTD